MAEFMRTVIRTGLPFGIAMGVVYYLQSRRAVAIVGGLIAGVLFGIAMALYQEGAKRRLQKLGVGTGDMKPVQERTVPLSVDANVAMEKAKSALAAIRKIRSDSIRANGNQITATTSMTWQSFGERISVEVLPTVVGSSVRIGSRPKIATTMMDGGKGRENVELFTKALTQ
jgi:hypothetical protein